MPWPVPPARPPRPATVLPLFLLLAALASVAVASAQSDHQHGGHGTTQPTTTAASPYAGRYDASATIRALTPEEIGQIERGEGAGFALPAELNGVPGPRHVLDMAAALNLTPDQQDQVQAIYDEMLAAVIPAGQRYLDAQQALEDGFRDRTLTEDTLAGQVAEVSRLEGDLATHHLTSHLRTAAVLTPDQIAEYNRLRGYD